MTPAQIARNDAAIRNLAGRLEQLGFPGDSRAEAERIAVDLFADGYRPVEKPPPLTGPGASREAREEAIRAAAEAVRAAKERDGR